MAKDLKFNHSPTPRFTQILNGALIWLVFQLDNSYSRPSNSLNMHLVGEKNAACHCLSVLLLLCLLQMLLQRFFNAGFVPVPGIVINLGTKKEDVIIGM